MQTYLALTFNLQVRRFERGLQPLTGLRRHHALPGRLPDESPPGGRAITGV